MTLPATDTFAGATPPVALQVYSANWTISAGAFQIVEMAFGGGPINVVQPNAAGVACMAAWNADAPTANQYSQAPAYPEENSSIHSGVACRCATTEHTGYDLRIHSYVPASHTATYELYRFNVGTPTLLATGTATFDDNDTLRLEVRDIDASTVRLVCKRNTVQFASYDDTNASRITAAGRLGISGYNVGGAGMRNWEGGNLPPPFEAAATDVASASAALTTQVRLGAAAADSASATGALTTAVQLAATAVDLATASGIIASGELLAASALDVATATAVLTTAVRFAGQAVDTAVASGALTSWASVTLSGSLYTGQGGVLDPNFWVDALPALGTTLYYDATHVTIYPNGEISSDVSDCAAVVQFFDGSSWALGLIVITSQMAGVAKDAASASGALTTAVQLAAAAEALVTATGAFSTGAGMSADATDAAAASGSLSTQIPLSALAQDVATAVAELVTQISLAATASASSSADGALNGVIALSAAANAVTSGLGTLSTGIRLAAAAQGSATQAGSLNTSIVMSASAQDAATAVAGLATSIALGGAANNSVTATGDLKTARLLVAAAIDAATAVAILSTGIALTANAEAISHASAALTTATAALADAAASSTVTAVLTDIIESPPIGAYVIDARMVVSKSLAVFGTRRTPRFNAKSSLQTAVPTFDLADQLAPGETLTGRVTLQIACIAGADADAETMLLGVPSYDPTGTKIMQPVRGGLDASTYQLRVAANTTNPHKAVALSALLPVRS